MAKAQSDSHDTDRDLDDPVHAIAEEYLDELLAGRSPSQQDYLDRYPELGEELETQLKLVALLRGGLQYET